MKFGLKLKDIQLGEVKIGEVEVNTELNIAEMVAIRKESEYMLENLPNYMEQLGTAFVTGVEIGRAVEEYIEDINTTYEEAEGLTQEDLMNMIKTVARQKAIDNFFRQ